LLPHPITILYHTVNIRHKTLPFAVCRAIKDIVSSGEGTGYVLRIGKYLEGSDCGLFQGDFPAFALKYG
jgi:hypothetical protein